MANLVKDVKKLYLEYFAVREVHDSECSYKGKNRDKKALKKMKNMMRDNAKRKQDDDDFI